MGKIILDSKITTEFDCIHVDSSNKQSSNAERGHLSWKNIKSTFRISLQITSVLIKNHIDVANIPLACNKMGFIKYILQVLPCFIFRTKVISRVGGSHFDKFYKNQNYFYKILIRQILDRIDCIIIRGKKQSKQFENIYNGRYECVYIPSTNMKGLSIKKDYKTKSQEKFNILFLAMVSQAKGAYDLLRAIPLVLCEENNVCFHFVGNLVTPKEEANITYLKPDSLDITQYIKENKLESYVSFYGSLCEDEKIQQFKNADLFVFPSYSEGSPFAVVEAMENGLPIIATKVGFLPELFENEMNILYVDFNSPSQIKESIIKLKSNRKLCRNMVNNNFEILRSKLSLESYENQMIHILYSVINS